MLGAAFLLSAAALPQGIAPASCETGEATAEQKAELRDFDFLIGDYSVTGHMWLGDRWSPPKPGAKPSRWNGRYGLGGRAIVDEWFNEDPGLSDNPSSGLNVRMKKPDGSWVMSWVSDGSYQVQHLVASLDGEGRPVMTQVYPERPGFKATFIRLDRDHWVRIHRARDAQGKDLPPIMLKATRIPCSRGTSKIEEVVDEAAD